MKRNAFALTLLAAAVVACQTGAAATPTPTAAPMATASATSSGASLIGDDGVTVTLDATPAKVVSLTPATTELMFALGMGDRLVGRTDYDDYPPEAAAVPAVATYQGVEIEKVVDIAPDLVLAGGNNFTHDDDIARLRELDIPVLVVYASDVDGVLSDIGLVGAAVGAEQEAASVAHDIQARIDEVTSALAGVSVSSVFYELGNEPELYGPARDSFVADMVVLAGGDPITTSDPAIFSIPLEQLVSADPEVIVLGDAAYGVCPDQVATRPGWGSISAVVSGAVRPVDDIIVTRPGPRLGEGLAALALAIHPDAAITPPTTGSTYCAEPMPT